MNFLFNTLTLMELIYKILFCGGLRKYK